MRKRLIILLLIVSPTLFAQLPEEFFEEAKKITKYDEYDGYIYQNTRYKDAYVVDEKSGTFNAKLRYNILSDQIEYKKSSKLYKVTRNTTTHVRIDDDYFYYCEFKNQRGLKRNGYFVLVELNENYRIYKRYSLDIKEPKTNGSVMEDKGSIRRLTTYFVEENGVILELPMKKNGILQAFSDKSEEIAAYMKQNKIKVKKEEDLIRLVSRYNALKSISGGPSRSMLTSTDDIDK